MTDDNQTPKSAQAAVRLIERHRRLTLALGVLLLVAMTLGLTRLQTDFTYRSYFHHDDPMLQQLEQFERRFGNDDMVVVGLRSPSGILDVETAELLRAFTERLWRVPHVIRVESLSNFNWVHNVGEDLVVEPLLPLEGPLDPALLDERKRIALAHEELPGWMLSPDGTTTLIYATLKPSFVGTPKDEPETMAAVRGLVREFSRGDHELHVTGQVAVNVALMEVAGEDLAGILPVVFVIIFGLVTLLVRSLLSVVLLLFVIVASILATVGMAGWLGYPVNTLNSTIPQVLLAIGVADTLHLLVSFRLGLLSGLRREDAAREALRKNFYPTLFTAITTAVGFFSFLGSPLATIESYGVIAGIGSLAAWLFVWLFVAPLTYVMPFKARPEPPAALERKVARARRAAWWLARGRTAIVVGFAVLCALAAYGATFNEVNADYFKYFTRDYPVRVANEFVERHIGGARGIELVIDSGAVDGITEPEFLARVDAFQTWIESQPGVTRAISIVDALKHTHRSLHAGSNEHFRLPTTREGVAQELLMYTMGLPQGMDINDRISARQDALRMTVRWNIAHSKQSVEMIERIEEEGRRRDLDVVATGKNRVWMNVYMHVTRSILSSFIPASIAIGLLMTVLFRSLKLGLVGMLPNVVPILLVGGVLPLTGTDLDLGTIIVASVVLGITVDDTIHVLENYRRLRSAGRSGQAAVEAILLDVGPALFIATLVMVCGFGALAFASFGPNVSFGVLTASLLVLALVIDMTLTLSLLAGKAEPAAASQLSLGRPAVVRVEPPPPRSP